MENCWELNSWGLALATLIPIITLVHWEVGMTPAAYLGVASPSVELSNLEVWCWCHDILTSLLLLECKKPAVESWLCMHVSIGCDHGDPLHCSLVTSEPPSSWATCLRLVRCMHTFSLVPGVDPLHCYFTPQLPKKHLSPGSLHTVRKGMCTFVWVSMTPWPSCEMKGGSRLEVPKETLRMFRIYSLATIKKR